MPDFDREDTTNPPKIKILREIFCGDVARCLLSKMGRWSDKNRLDVKKNEKSLEMIYKLSL